MSIPLSTFLIEASQNPTLLRRLKEAPGTVAEEAGLDQRELRALLSEDPIELHWILSGDLMPPPPLMLTPQSVADN